MRPLLVVVASLALGCAPMVRVRRDSLPAVPVQAHSLTVLSSTTTGDVALDVLQAVIDPLGALNRIAMLTPEAARQFERTLASGGIFRILGPCGGPCAGSDAVALVRVVDGQRREVTGPKDKTRRYEGWASVEVRIVDSQGALLFGRTWSGSSRGAGDVVWESVLNAATHAAQAMLPSTLVDTFTLVEEGPLAGAAKAAAQGELDVAERGIRSFLAGSPQSGVGRFHLGVVLTARGELDAALAEMIAAEQLDGAYAGAADAARERIATRDRMRAFYSAHSAQVPESVPQ